MQAYDAQVLSQQLNALCEVYDKKPVSLKGCEVWFDVLKEFPTEKVMSVLIAWPKTHNKFPTPSEVWKVVNEINIAERERKAEIEKKEEFFPGVGGAQAKKFIAEIRKLLNKPQWSPMEHWRHTLNTQPEGSIGHTYAKQVLGKAGYFDDEPKHRPGADDIEAERAAVNF
jgi:hypothetical protein